MQYIQSMHWYEDSHLNGFCLLICLVQQVVLVGLALNLTVITVGQDPVNNSTASVSLPLQLLRTRHRESVQPSTSSVTSMESLTVCSESSSVESTTAHGTLSQGQHTGHSELPALSS
jgi:hypothetical protein